MQTGDFVARKEATEKEGSQEGDFVRKKKRKKGIFVGASSEGNEEGMKSKKKMREENQREENSNKIRKNYIVQERKKD